MRWLALLLALFVAGCDGSDPPPDPAALPQEYDPIAPCLMDGMQALVDVIRRNAEVFLQLRDPVGSGIATPAGGPTMWVYDAGNLTGAATFSSDPAGGMQVGDSVEVTWTYMEAGVTGAGTFTVTLITDTEASVHGFGEVHAGGGCTLDIDIASTEALLVDLTQFSSLSGAAATPPLAGNIALTVVSGQYTLSVVVVLNAGGISLSNATLNGAPLPPVTFPWSLFFGPPPPLPPPPGGAVTANWNGTWYMWYRCVLFGNPLFDGNTTIDISHTAGATSFTGTETEVVPGGTVVYPLATNSLGGNSATVVVEFEYTPAAGSPFQVIEEQTWTWYAEGKGLDQGGQLIDIPGAPERICKLGRVVRKDNGEYMFTCFGTAIRDDAPSYDPLSLVCGSWSP